RGETHSRKGDRLEPRRGVARRAAGDAGLSIHRETRRGVAGDPDRRWCIGPRPVALHAHHRPRSWCVNSSAHAVRAGFDHLETEKAGRHAETAKLRGTLRPEPAPDDAGDDDSLRLRLRGGLRRTATDAVAGHPDAAGCETPRGRANEVAKGN